MTSVYFTLSSDIGIRFFFFVISEHRQNNNESRKKMPGSFKNENGFLRTQLNDCRGRLTSVSFFNKIFCSR